MSDYNSSLPVRTEAAGDVIVKVADATVPSQQLTVEADGSINVNTTLSPGSQVEITDGTDTLEINPDGSINITDNGGSITVDGTVTVTATDLDIRDLDQAQDSVEVFQATHDNLNANANLQVGNADVANGNPVPVSDAGGSLTVDAVDLDIRDLVFATDKVDVSGSSVTVTATDLDIRDLDAAQDNVAISDGTDTLEVNADGSINSVVTATDLDIRDLTHVSDSVKVGDGTDFLAVNTDGSINVVVKENPGSEVLNYNTSAALAAAASSNHDYTTTNFLLQAVYASASGKMKIQVQVETAAASNVFNTVDVQFNSTASPNMEFALKSAYPVPAGAKVRVIRTNLDNQSQDVYSTIAGIEQ